MKSRNTEQRMTWWLLVPAGIALLASGVFVGRTGVRPAAARPERLEEGISKADEQRISVLEQELSRLRIALNAAVQKDEATEPEPLPPEGKPDAEEDHAEPERDPEQARTEYLDGLGDRVDTEPRDARWQADTEPTISRILPQQLGSDVTVSDVACGSSVCRAKVNHRSAPRLSGEKISDFLFNRGSLATMQVEFDLRDEGVTTMYFMRAPQ